MTKPVAVIIGIGPKNGAAFARRFAADGYATALLSRKTEYSSKLAEEIGDSKAYACDVSSDESIEAAFAAIRTDLGPVDVVVYNAGSGVFGTIEEIDAAAFEMSWRINTMGLFQVSKHVVPEMVERKKGSIVVVGATASLRGKPFTTAFAPAKAAQRSLAQAMARHLAPKGVHVSLIIIDGMVTEPQQVDAEAPDKLNPEHIADAASFLAHQKPTAWTFELDVRPRLENW